MDSAHDSPKFWTGLLLAGGASKRMGQCKAQLTISATSPQTFLQKSWALLETVTATQWLLGKHDFVSPEQQLNDRSTFAGPLKALVDVLPRIQTDWILLIPVDMPGLSEQLLGEFQQFASQTSKGCMTKGLEGLLGFPVAIPRSGFGAILEAARHGETSLFRLLETLKFAEWTTVSNRELALKNINTPDQLGTWRTAMESTWNLAK